MRFSTRAGVRRPRGVAALATLSMLLAMVPIFFSPLPVQGIADEPEEAITNPDLGEACGLDILMILDETGSMSDDEGDMEDAYRDFILALENSGSRIGVVDFSSRNPSGNFGESDATAGAPDDITYNTTGYIETSTANVQPGGVLRDYVDAIPDGYEPAGYTNWQEALWGASQFESDYGNADLAIFFTDGDPNTVDANTPGYAGTNGELDGSGQDTAAAWAVEYSNDLKDGNTHILGLGLGLGGDASTARLASVTGTNGATNPGQFNPATTDYVTFGDASDIATALETVAIALCNTTLSITKWVPESPDYDFEEKTGFVTGGSGWEFDFTLSGDYEWLGQEPPQSTDLGGTVQFDWRHDVRGSTVDLTGLSETVQDGYELLGGVCVISANGQQDQIVVLDGSNDWAIEDIPDLATVDCDIYNEAGFISLDKTVINDDGGSATEADFTLSASGQSNGGLVSGPGDQGPTLIPADTYSISETTNNGYTPGPWTCDDVDVSTGSATGVVEVPVGAHVICEISNDDVMPTLTLQKDVELTYGGAAADTEWELTASGETTTISGSEGDSQVTDAEIPGGTYTLGESPLTTEAGNYSLVGWSCDNGDDDGTVTLNSGDDVICTATNVSQPASLTLVKEIEPNDFGASADPETWRLQADGPGDNDLSGYGTVGSTSLPAGAYQLSESEGPGGWQASEWVCDQGSYQASTDTIILGIGDEATCTVTNSAVQPRLTLQKQLVLGSGGNESELDFLLKATSATFTLDGYNGVTTQGPDNGGADDVTDEPVDVGTYTLSEEAPLLPLDAYSQSGDWVCVGGEWNESEPAQITLGPGDSATCTITNTDNAPTLQLAKEVANDDGGTAEPEDFVLLLNGETAVHGENLVVANQVYEVSEETMAGYEQTDLICRDDDSQDLVSHPVTLSEGQSVTCTVYNDDQPGSITVVKGFAHPTDAEPDDFSLTINGEIVLSGEDNELDGNETYTVAEQQLEGWAQIGEIACEDSEGGVDHPVELELDQHVTCTIVNGELPTITVEKIAIGEDEATFEFSGDLGDFDFDENGGSEQFTVQPGEYTVSETQAEFWALTDISCEDGAVPEMGQASAHFDVGYGDDQRCTFSNERLPESIEIVTSGVCINDAPYLQWTVNPINFNGSDVAITWLDLDPQDPLYASAGNPHQGTMLWPGTIVDGDQKAVDWAGWVYIDPDTLTEMPLGTPGGVWVTGDDGYQDTRPSTSIMFSISSDVAVDVTYPGGEPLCDGPPPQIWVEKEVIGEGSQTFQFTFNTGGFDLDDNTLAHGDTGMSGPLAVGDGFSVSEVVPGGWLDPVATCDDGSDPSDIDLSVGETVICSFQNEIEPEVLASVLVTVAGVCELDGDKGVGRLNVTMSVAGGATVVLYSGDNVVTTLTDDGVVEVPEGQSYTWEATPNEGFEFPPGFVATGVVTIETCTEILPFTGIDADLLAATAALLLGLGLLVLMMPRRRGRHERP